MNEKIKQQLTEFAKQNNWGADVNDLFEIVREAPVIYSEKISSHRWYDLIFYVCEINGFRYGYEDYYMTGDNNAHDMGLEYRIDSVCEVVAEEKTVIVFKKL